MTIKNILCFGLVLSIFTTLYVQANNDTNTTVKCQFVTPLRKQVDAEPIDGTCLRVIVVQLSKALKSIADKELSISSFREILDKIEFTNISSNLESRLNTLVDKLNQKLMSHVDLLHQSSDVILPVLLKIKSNSAIPNQGIVLGVQKKDSDICSQIMNALATNVRSQEWKNLHVLPISHPETMCGPPSLAHNIGPLLLSQCRCTKYVILLLEHGEFMSEGDLALAQITAKTIIDMLSESDYVTVVGLAGHGSIHCKYGLLRATDINKFQLARHIDSITRIETNRSIDINFKVLT